MCPRWSESNFDQQNSIIIDARHIPVDASSLTTNEGEENQCNNQQETKTYAHSKFYIKGIIKKKIYKKTEVKSEVSKQRTAVCVREKTYAA